MKNTAEVHLVPTDKPSKYPFTKGMIVKCIKEWTPIGEPSIKENTLSFSVNESEDVLKYYQPQHLYFTNNEEPKDGDKVLLSFNIMGNHTVIGTLQEVTAKISDSHLYNVIVGSTTHCIYKNDNVYDLAKKITATTNHELWLMAAKSGSKGPIYNIAKIPTSFIESYIKTPVKEVELEYEADLTQGHSVCVCGRAKGFSTGDRCTSCGSYKESRIHPIKLKLSPNGEVIWSVKQKKMYTREELKSAILTVAAFPKPMSTKRFKEWFDKHYPQ